MKIQLKKKPFLSIKEMRENKKKNHPFCDLNKKKFKFEKSHKSTFVFSILFL